MLDKFFCKRLHVKKITLEMVMYYIEKWFECSPLLKECLCIAIILEIAGVIIKLSNYSVTSIVWWLMGLFVWEVVGIVGFLMFIKYIAPKIQIASCPLTKTGGN